MEPIVANDLKQNSQVLHICPPATDSRLVKFFTNYCTGSIAMQEDFLAKTLFNLFVDRLPVFLAVLPVQAKTCAFRYFPPVLLKCDRSRCFSLVFTFGVVVVNHSFGDMNSSNLWW